MKIEIVHRFTATHAHPVPPDGQACEEHAHDWVLTVVLEGPLHPTFGWVADFRCLEGLTGQRYEGTCEQILAGLVHELAWSLGPEGPVVVRAELQEMPGCTAVYEAGDPVHHSIARRAAGGSR